jgi:lipoprotein-anchoring transpeptidase ErfK/SrfK
MRRFIFALACAGLLACSPIGGRAHAEVIIVINKSVQRMIVAVNGREQYDWPVSTGVAGGPPSGHYRPERLEREWHSRRFNWSPMPYSIFFHEGYAIHGTYHLSRLGSRASHGCVRLHPGHAATLFNLVRSHGMSRTRIMVASSPRYAARRW